MSRYFIIGTGTDVGKTYVAAQLLSEAIKNGHRAAYYKPAMSGNIRVNDSLIPGDAAYVKEVSDTDQPLDSMCSFIYEPAISPHLAANEAQEPVEIDRIKQDILELEQNYSLMIMEGCGGIICPLRYDANTLMQADLIKQLKATTILVADAGLGTINATVLTTEYLKDKNIPLQGIILNQYDQNNPMHQDNLKLIEDLSHHPVIATLASDSSQLVWRVPSILEPEVEL